MPESLDKLRRAHRKMNIGYMGIDSALNRIFEAELKTATYDTDILRLPIDPTYQVSLQTADGTPIFRIGTDGMGTAPWGSNGGPTV